MKFLSIINFFISSSALAFQVTVLFPWHNTISKQIDNIERKIETQHIKVK